MKTTVAIVLLAAATAGCAHLPRQNHLNLDNLRRVVLKEINFQKASLPDVFAFINQHVDTLAEAPYGPMFALDPNLGKIEITMQAKDMDLKELVTIITQMGNFDLKPAGNWVIATPLRIE